MADDTYDDEDDSAGWTIFDVVRELRGLEPDTQRLLMERMSQAVGPSMALEVFFPADDAVTRVSTLARLRELKAREEAERLFRESRPTTPVVVADLERVVERLDLGLETRPEPTVGGLLYPGRVNAVYGTHTAGKTWLALHLARANADTGSKTLVIDYEDSAVGIADRCRAMGGNLAKSVRYLAPAGRVDAAALAELIRQKGITLVVLDSVGESLAMGGYDSNAERDVTQWFTEVPDALAALGPAVLVIDHIAKKQDGNPTPVGSFRKSAAITGAMFALENKVGFSRHQAGWSLLTCTKDRNGYFATGQVVGRVQFSPADGAMDIAFAWGDEQQVRDRMEQAILDYVLSRMDEVHGKLDEDGEEMDGRPNITQIRGAVQGDNGKIKAAVDRLVAQGNLALEHRKMGKTTRDVYVPSTPVRDFGESDPDE